MTETPRTLKFLMLRLRGGRLGGRLPAVQPAWELWGIAALFLVGGELYTRAFVLLWPAIGAAAAALAALLGLSIDGQLLLFSLTSVALLALSRTLFTRILSREGRLIATNAAAIAGRPVEILEPVGDLHAPGTVRLGGELWAAFTVGAERLAPGQAAVVEKVVGLKLCIRGVAADWPQPYKEGRNP